MRSLRAAALVVVLASAGIVTGCGSDAPSDAVASDQQVPIPVGSAPRGGIAETIPPPVLREVVVKESFVAPLRSQPDARSPEIGSFPEGTVFRVLEERPDAEGTVWLRVTGPLFELDLRDGSTVPDAWITSTVVETPG